MNLQDFGDAMVETKQLAPGPRADSVFHFGRLSGSPEGSPDIDFILPVEEQNVAAIQKEPVRSRKASLPTKSP